MKNFKIISSKILIFVLFLTPFSISAEEVVCLGSDTVLTGKIVEFVDMDNGDRFLKIEEIGDENLFSFKDIVVSGDYKFDDQIIGEIMSFQKVKDSSCEENIFEVYVENEVMDNEQQNSNPEMLIDEVIKNYDKDQLRPNYVSDKLKVMVDKFISIFK